MGKIISTMDEVAIGNQTTTWANADKRGSQGFDGPVPLDVAVGIVGWNPVGFDLPTLVDPNTMDVFQVPDRYRQVVGRVRPDGSRAVINIAGDGYAKDLHNAMREAAFVAGDGEFDIILAACHNDGEFLCLQMTSRDGLNIAGPGGDYVPLVTLMSSLTGNTKTRLTTGSLRLFCTNQLRQFNLDKINEVGAKRTRNAETKFTPALIADKLEFSFAETRELVAQLDRLCNVGLSDAWLSAIYDRWQPLNHPDGTPKEGRGRTMAENARGSLTRLLTRDTRVNLGMTVGGLWQAHNTWQHWEQSSRGSDSRIARMAERASLGQSDAEDAKFMAIVADIVPDVSRILVPA